MLISHGKDRCTSRMLEDENENVFANKNHLSCKECFHHQSRHRYRMLENENMSPSGNKSLSKECFRHLYHHCFNHQFRIKNHNPQPAMLANPCLSCWKDHQDVDQRLR